MATHSGTLAWRIPWTEEPGAWGQQRARHDWAISLSLFNSFIGSHGHIFPARHAWTERLQKLSQSMVHSWVGKIHWRRDSLPTPVFLGFPCGSAGKESTCNVGDMGLIPALERAPGEGNGYPLQYSGLENSIGYTVHGAGKESDTTEWLALSLSQSAELITIHSLPLESVILYLNSE